MAIARKALPALVTFDSKFSDPQAQFANAGEFDRRMLQSLERSAWDSVATSVMQRVTDRVIDDAIATLPPEYASRSTDISNKLKARRNALRGVADRYYGDLWKFADIHGTDADEQLTVNRSGDGIVDVTIQEGNNAPYFSRRFLASETQGIRIYLHGGNDRAPIAVSTDDNVVISPSFGSHFHMLR